MIFKFQVYFILVFFQFNHLLIKLLKNPKRKISTGIDINNLHAKTKITIKCKWAWGSHYTQYCHWTYNKKNILPLQQSLLFKTTKTGVFKKT